MPGMYLKPRTLASVVMEVSGVVIRELSADEGKNTTQSSEPAGKDIQRKVPGLVVVRTLRQKSRLEAHVGWRDVEPAMIDVLVAAIVACEWWGWTCVRKPKGTGNDRGNAVISTDNGELGRGKVESLSEGSVGLRIFD